jgi:hypothetical protein
MEVEGDQGDQIGRIFALLVITDFGQSLENYRSNCATFSKALIKCILISTINWLGYILDDFFTNSSGRPEGGQDLRFRVDFWTFCCPRQNANKDVNRNGARAGRPDELVTKSFKKRPKIAPNRPKIA